MKTNLANTIRKISSWASLSNKRRSPANGSNTSSVGGVTSLILLSMIIWLGGLVASLLFSQDTFAATISMSSSGAQSIDIMPDSSGGTGTSIGVDNLNITTDCRAGYNLSMSTSVNDNNLYLNGSSSNNQSGKYFSPADGSSTLTNSPNTWGYLESSTAPTATSTFSAVPALGNAAVIRTTSQTASSSDINDNIDIYYGVAVSNGLAPGTYKMIPDTNNSNADGGIVYYLTMDTGCEAYTISYNANGGSGSIASQEVTPGSSVTLADNAFTRSNYYFKGWATTSGGSVAYRTNQSITPTGNMTLYAVWGSSTSQTLYNIVASLTRGNQTNDTNATTGLQTNPTKATSGVWTYNASTFGTASDASTSNAIYYYRGILDNVTGTYGSNGDSMDYPNYVKLGITCWRIVRTTGSGGVKMIYNGMYGNTTSGSCANAQAAAAIRATSATTADSTATFTSAFADTSDAQYRSIVGVGYTRNDTYASTSATTATAYSTLFGTNSSYSGNSTNSTIKGNIETWFTNNLNSYASKLEASAGYCNDRTLYPDGSYATSNLISDSTTIVPYGSSGMTVYYFGAYARNTNSAQSPTLTCPRATVDLYTASSASNGNKQLSKPVALLTADEMSFAGSGNYIASDGSGYNSNSYLHSGSYFWLLSPSIRNKFGNPSGFVLSSTGFFSYNLLKGTNGVRPAISLTSGTKPASGSGTATDPWVVEEPPKPMQSVTSDDLATLMPNTGDTATLVDERDGEEYMVGKLADGKYWMLENLRLGSSTDNLTLTSNDTNITSTVGSWTLPKSSTTCFSDASCTNGAGSTGTGYTVPAINTDSKNTLVTSYGTAATNGQAKVGVYYNYCAAVAGDPNLCVHYNSSSNASADRDICPKGWKLPTTGSSNNSAGSYYYLCKTSYSDNATNIRNALSTPLSGTFYNGSAGYQGSSGFFWSATLLDNTRMWRLYVTSSNVLSSAEGNRSVGGSIRCLLK